MCLNHLEPLLPRALNFQHTSGHVDLVLVDLNNFLESRSRAALLVSAMAIQLQWCSRVVQSCADLEQDKNHRCKESCWPLHLFFQNHPLMWLNYVKVIRMFPQMGVPQIIESLQ